MTVTGSVERTAVTDPEGEYSIDALPSGNYSARAELVGFVTATETVEVAREQVTVDFHLESPVCGRARGAGRRSRPSARGRHSAVLYGLVGTAAQSG